MPDAPENVCPAKWLDKHMHTENKTKKLKSSHHLGTLMKPFVLVRKLNSMEDLRIASVPLTCMISKLMFLSSFFKNLLKVL